MSHGILKSHFFADDGETIHLYQKGNGSPIVMLHGWTADHQEWLPFIDELSHHHHVVLWDARGHGGHTLSSKTEPSVQAMARDLRELIDRLGLSHVTLVGHSMGALTAWEYISQFGTHGLAKLCLIDQSPRLLTDEAWKFGIHGAFDEERSAQFVADLQKDFAEAMMRICAYGLNEKARIGYERNTRGWQGERERLRKQNPQPLIQVWESLVKTDYRDVLGTIDIPALLIYGDESNFYVPDTALYVKERMPQSVLHMYAGTDHSPHLWEVKRFINDLLGFIKK
ncbi:MAG: alpha/beta hydrolase [Burkholderiales bacterium]|nr:alpha/beta hydrolase [Burkholderiales bacterium]